MGRLRAPKHFAKDKRGSVTIEFVAVMPIFLAALAFTWEFGQLFLAYQSTASNARAAARYLSRLDNPSGFESRARRIIRTGQVDSGVQPFKYLEDACNGSYGDCIRVTQTAIIVDVRIDYPLAMFGFLGGSQGGTLPIRVVETSRRMGS